LSNAIPSTGSAVRLLPLREKVRLAGENEATLPGLDVENPQFESVGGDQHVLRMQRPPLRVSCILDCEQKSHEHSTDYERERYRREHHPLRDAAVRPERSAGCIASV
jgi:hypothetical protein